MSWLNKDFRYTPVSKQGEGYLQRRFRQIRAEQKAAAEQAAKNAAEAQSKTIILPRAKSA